MNFPELLFGILLALALFGLAGFFTWRQFKTRLALARDRTILPDERTYLIRQTRRRLLCSMLMLFFALFLVGWFFIEPDDLKAVPGEDRDKVPFLVEVLTYYWIAALLVLFGILALAGMDFFATARHGMQQKKLLEVERRTALEIEAARLRQQRNGS